MSASAVGFAIAAAICLAAGSALQHHAVAGEDGYRSGLRLVWRLARQRRWLTGMAVTVVGSLLQAAALSTGALAVVQPVLVLGVALALPARALLERVRPSARQALAAVALAGGVTVFVVSAHPGAGQPVPDAGAAAVLIAAGVAVAGLCSVSAARTRSGRVAAFALGLAAGTLYGVAGGVLKITVQAVLQDPLAVVAGWPLWALAGIGAWAFVMHQRAYAHAPLSVSLPAISVAGPLAGMVFGTLVFGETPAAGPLAVSGQVAGLAVIAVSVVMLARPAAAGGSHRSGRGTCPGAAGRRVQVLPGRRISL